MNVVMPQLNDTIIDLKSLLAHQYRIELEGHGIQIKEFWLLKFTSFRWPFKFSGNLVITAHCHEQYCERYELHVTPPLDAIAFCLSKKKYKISQIDCFESHSMRCYKQNKNVNNTFFCFVFHVEINCRMRGKQKWP